MYRGEIWWSNLPDPVGSEPGGSPVFGVITQAYDS
jgi:mRNA-degrading endonuclease toxin of MazEF toxin-antitoxin module